MPRSKVLAILIQHRCHLHWGHVATTFWNVQFCPHHTPHRSSVGQWMFRFFYLKKVSPPLFKTEWRPCNTIILWTAIILNGLWPLNTFRFPPFFPEIVALIKIYKIFNIKIHVLTYPVSFSSKHTGHSHISTSSEPRQVALSSQIITAETERGGFHSHSRPSGTNRRVGTSLSPAPTH